MIWNTSTVFAARDRQVVARDGARHTVKLYADGWAIAGHEGMDIWAAAALLNNLRAELAQERPQGAQP